MNKKINFTAKIYLKYNKKYIQKKYAHLILVKDVDLANGKREIEAWISKHELNYCKTPRLYDGKQRSVDMGM